MNKIVTPFRVGILVIVAVGAFASFFMFVRKGGLSPKESLEVWAAFHDASGLGPKSRIQIAGIQVGEVESIALEGETAKVTMLIKRGVPVKTDAAIVKRSESLLGDYMLDLVPGSAKTEEMPEGGQVVHVQESSGVEALEDKLGAITGDIKEVTASLRTVLGGDQGAQSLQHIVANLSQMSDNLNETIRQNGERVDAILANFKGVSEDVRGVTDNEEARIKAIVENIQKISEDIKEVLAKVDQVLGAGQGGVQDTVSEVKETLGKLNASLENVQDITGRINKGEGTLGQLINDKRLGTALTDTVVDASDYVSRLVNLQTEITLRTEYLWYEQTTKDYLELKLTPKPDKYYTIALVDDPRGVVTTSTVRTIPPSTTQVPVQTITTTNENQLKFSAQFNKRYYFAAFRFGLIENTGGVGVDLFLLNDSLTFKVDAFDFSDATLKYPRIKAYANYAFLGHAFVTGGVDDVFNPPLRDPTTRNFISGREYLLGGGLYFTDDDLKAVLLAVPKP